MFHTMVIPHIACIFHVACRLASSVVNALDTHQYSTQDGLWSPGWPGRISKGIPVSSRSTTEMPVTEIPVKL